MNELRVRDVGLVNINDEELMVRGGAINWGQVFRQALEIGLEIYDFVDTYGDDMLNGLKDGWKSVKC